MASKPSAKETTEEVFARLTPDLVFSVAESLGFEVTGELFQLNSFENRVFDLRLEPETSELDNLILKFYRPNRWTRDAILEEHQFLFELDEAEVPVVLPLRDQHGESLLQADRYFVGVFPKIRARMPDELPPPELQRVGALLARLHMVSSRLQAQHRPTVGAHYYGGWETLELLTRWISPEVSERYIAAATGILEQIDEILPSGEFRRIHGDFHRGNILLGREALSVVDFDDFCNGPEVQDVWMLFAEDPSGSTEEWDAFLTGYESFREFPMEQIEWIPLLRALRVMGYAGWIANRWDEKSFQRLFPDFNTYRYWATETESLEKIAWSLHSS